MMRKLCETCSTICPLCKRAESRMWHLMRNKRRRERGLQESPFISDEEAIAILGCTPRALARFIDTGEVYIEKHRTRQRIALVDVLNIKSGRAVEIATKVLPETHTAILSSLDRFANNQLKNYSAIDDILVEYGLVVGPKIYTYGHTVVQRTPPRQGWYVYHLCRPDGKVFYVGKGQGGRMYNHAAEARAGVVGHKCNIIRKLWRSKKDIVYRVVFVTPVEQEAYMFEGEEIRRIGIRNLSNVVNSAYIAHRQIIPLECYTYAQLADRFAARGGRVPTDVLPWWSLERRHALRAARDLAVAIQYRQAVETIDRELDALHTLELKQRPIFDGWTDLMLQKA